MRTYPLRQSSSLSHNHHPEHSLADFHLLSERPRTSMADKDAYISALEQKLAELSGIEVDQIKKNQLANAADEARVIGEMAAYVASITVQRAAEAQVGLVSPQIADIYSYINAELSEARGAHVLPPLKYDYNALEPHISGTIMEIHHTKHHQAYINNLKAATDKLIEAEQNNDVNAMNALLPAIKFNGGGHLNHTIFWTNMSPNGGGEPSGSVADAINAEFGSFQAFKDKFSAASVGVKGSGWGWLGYCPKNDKVAVATCQNQDPLQLTHGLVPLLGLDVWEHAYYLQYKNLRADYVKAFFNVIDWSNVNERYENARKAAGH
ncbi:superoxide dismutase [Mn], mitochondrial-like isoform X3 [Macrobrachium rosenbergii]|uniref:superoxide dismutase [Mn], mitochondrial-like isoform X3 n=1 Tax=Macrobrachium rosenbergii TaxID=79674 RepID=UPI0034D54FA5